MPAGASTHSHSGIRTQTLSLFLFASLVLFVTSDSFISDGSAFCRGRWGLQEVLNADPNSIGSYGLLSSLVFLDIITDWVTSNTKLAPINIAVCAKPHMSKFNEMEKDYVFND